MRLMHIKFISIRLLGIVNKTIIRYLKYNTLTESWYILLMTSTNYSTNQIHLLAKQYSNDKNLVNRMALHERYNKNSNDWFPWIYSHFFMPDNGNLLELGSGTAELWKTVFSKLSNGWNITLSDFSEGMLDSAKANLGSMQNHFSFEVIDAQDIPKDDRSVNAVVANHMLYHVPDKDKAIAEIRRILKKDGCFFGTTIGETHMHELITLVNKYRENKNAGFSYSFTIENGKEYLEKQFEFVHLSQKPAELLVDDVKPLLAYVMSSENFKPDDDKLEDFIKEASDHIIEHGHFTITPSNGLFIAGDKQL